LILSGPGIIPGGQIPALSNDSETFSWDFETEEREDDTPTLQSEIPGIFSLPIVFSSLTKRSTFNTFCPVSKHLTKGRFSCFDLSLLPEKMAFNPARVWWVFIQVER
jgi:hypothetical protein